jgi:glutathione S-transferase
MRYTLWGEPNSGSFMVEAALAEAKQSVDLIDLDLTRDEHRAADYRQVSPLCKIPALRFPDGSVMTESAAILLALDEAHPDALLMPPRAGGERRSALRWLLYIAAEIYPLIEMSDYPHRFAPPETSDVGMRSVVRTRLRERWRAVEEAAGGGGSFLPTGFSAVDLSVAVISRWEVGDEWRAKEGRKLDAIARAVAERPSIAPVWRRHFGAKA